MKGNARRAWPDNARIHHRRRGDPGRSRRRGGLSGTTDWQNKINQLVQQLWGRHEPAGYLAPAPRRAWTGNLEAILVVPLVLVPVIFGVVTFRRTRATPALSLMPHLPPAARQAAVDSPMQAPQRWWKQEQPDTANMQKITESVSLVPSPRRPSTQCQRSSPCTAFRRKSELSRPTVLWSVLMKSG